MTEHVPVLIVLVPMVAALLAPVVALASRPLGRGLTLAALAGATLASLVALERAVAEGPWRYQLGGWPPPWGIEYVVDALGGTMAVLVSGMAFLGAIHSVGRPPRSAGEQGVFDALFLLLTSGLLGIVVTGDVFNLYVFLEIAALAGYALLASGDGRSVFATFRYLLVGTIAASLYLLGIGYLYALTGTLNMADLAERIPGLAAAGGPVLPVAVSLIVVGLAIKMALFPLHGWLPNAYTHSPAPVTPFVAAVMGKVGAYALLRMLFFVIGPGVVTERALTLLAWAGAAAVVAGSAMALAQRDVRRMLAYSSVGQIGYAALGIGIGNAAALTGAFLHIVNHAVLKGCLFMVAGGLHERSGVVRLADYAGLGRRAPLALAGLVVAGLSMVGLPPLGGFFSKWYLLAGALEAGQWAFVSAIAASSLLTAAYVFRLVETAYFREPPAEVATAPRAELPAAMLAPVLVLAALVVALGLFNQGLVAHVLRFALPPSVP
jgi:multicomponent Na+:H+ antiporter subunit D